MTGQISGVSHKAPPPAASMVAHRDQHARPSEYLAPFMPFAFG